MEENQIPKITGLEIKKSEISELNELISVIVDYYCFKSKVSDEEEGDEWKKKFKEDGEEAIVPEILDGLIKKSFESQLKRFI